MVSNSDCSIITIPTFARMWEMMNMDMGNDEHGHVSFDNTEINFFGRMDI